MRYAVFGDVHGNLEALDAALRQLESLQIDRYLCTGDLVGYGADPGPCVDRVRQLDAVVVCGNHDLAVAGRLDFNDFNEFAIPSLQWACQTLTDEQRQYLHDLPLVQIVDDEICLVHGSPYQPEEFHYLESKMEALAAFGVLATRIGFFGHSHMPRVWLGADGTVESALAERCELPDGKHCLINVGSIGQPRDRDPRACFAVYDTDQQTVEFHRVEYDVETARQKILDAKLSSWIAERLAHGM